MNVDDASKDLSINQINNDFLHKVTIIIIVIIIINVVVLYLQQRDR